MTFAFSDTYRGAKRCVDPMDDASGGAQLNLSFRQQVDVTAAAPDEEQIEKPSGHPWLFFQP